MSVKENERWYQSAGQSARTHGRKKEGQENDDLSNIQRTGFKL